MKKIIALLLMMTFVFMFTACGGSGTEDAGASEESGQNPIMNFVGDYTCDRASIHIEALDETDKAKATVTWGSSAFETSEWVMTGTFDSQSLSFDYEDGIRTDYKYAENGDIEEQKEVYTGGKGHMAFTEGDTLELVWIDEQENIADDMTFTYSN